MVLEHAILTIRPGDLAAFEEAVARARPIIAASPGFISLALHRGVETPNQYLLLVEWEHLDDHLVGFRESSAFHRWRTEIGPYFESPPVGDHYEVVDGLG